MWFKRALIYNDLEYQLTFQPPFFGAESDLGFAVYLRSPFHHIILFFRFYPSNDPVVFHPNKQTPAISIGEGNKRPGDLFRIGDLKLEIKSLMLALGDKVFYIIVHWEKRSLDYLNVKLSFAVVFSQ